MRLLETTPSLQPGTGLGSIPFYGCFMLSSTMRTSRVPSFVEWNFPLAIWLLRTVCILSLCGKNSLRVEWNDPAFEPSTEALTEMHTNFLDSEIITHDLVAHMTPATAEKVELKWNEVKNVLTRIIGNWGLSGQGEGKGGIIARRSDGMFNDRAQHALNTRRDVFTNHNTYFFYFWIQLEKHQLLASMLQKLGDNVAAKDGIRGGATRSLWRFGRRWIATT